MKYPEKIPSGDMPEIDYPNWETELWALRCELIEYLHLHSWCCCDNPFDGIEP